MDLIPRRSILRSIGGWACTAIAIPLASSAAVAPWAATAFAQALGDDDRKIQFNIPSQSLSTALIAYAEQAKVQLIVPAEALNGLTAIAISGEFDARTALRTLLGQSNLGFEVTAPRTITVSRKTAE